jgi:hypothetical protein
MRVAEGSCQLLAFSCYVSGTAGGQNPYSDLLLVEGRVSADGGSQLEGIWDAFASAVFNLIDSYGWILPAVALSILFLGLIVLVAWCLEDLPFEPEIFDGIGGIFRWTRKWWKDSRDGGLSLRG